MGVTRYDAQPELVEEPIDLRPSGGRVDHDDLRRAKQDHA
jgi:hypothetical protein